jgi:hypothetical protein
MIGMPTIIPKVNRSRFSWMNSLPTMPSQRENEKIPLMAPCSRRRGGGSARLHQVDEYVLEARLNPAPRAARLGLERREGGVEGGRVGAGDVQRRAERRHLVHRRQCPQLRRQPGQRRALDGPGDERLARDDVACRTLRQQPSARECSQLVAALGLSM